MSDFNVKITVRNNRIFAAMRRRGITSQTELARLSGININRVNALVCFREKPIANGDWSQDAWSISSALHVEPEDLWPDHMRHLKTTKNSVEFSTDEAGVRALAAPANTVIDGRLLRSLVAKLPERAGYIVASRFGLVDGCEMSLDDVAASLNLSKERVRQIEAKAMRSIQDKLRKRGIKTAQAFIEEPPSHNMVGQGSWMG